ncbi:E3 ubiquitin-protein ligase RNF10-like isoform X2 [Mytilus trossulus]|uniref:E3 ubiquitin-protein ligase RNF10-like isoform X2 n=1 Tax=Mytilus trossulus TaxID=6551 RepID=UPI003003E63F
MKITCIQRKVLVIGRQLSVVTQEVHKYNTGETVTMTLMRREKGMTYALPKAVWEKKEGKIHSYTDDVNKTNFLKLLSMSEEDIQKFVVEPERLTLQNKLKDAETSEVAFIDSALHLLNTRQQTTDGPGNTSSSRSESESSTEEIPESAVSVPKMLPSTKVSNGIMNYLPGTFNTQDPRQSPPVDVLPDSLPVEEAAEYLEMPVVTED